MKQIAGGENRQSQIEDRGPKIANHQSPITNKTGHGLGGG
jgi:hypothetical protein